MDTNTSVPSPQHQRQQLRQRLNRLATILDSAVAIPGTKIRLGADAVIGLIPGVGDAAGFALGLWMIWQARRVQAPSKLQLKMLGNLAVEALIGIVPLFGDVFDILWQANQRNRKILVDWMDQQDEVAEPSSGQAWVLYAVLVVCIAGIIWAALV